MSYILFADDDRDFAEALMHFLHRAGHRVEHVSDGKAAVEAVIQKLPDVLVLDVHMPMMSGRSALEVLRSYVRLIDLPVIVFTADDDAPAEQCWDKLGVQQVMVKARHGPMDILRAIEAITDKPDTPHFIADKSAPSDRPLSA